MRSLRLLLRSGLLLLLVPRLASAQPRFSVSNFEPTTTSLTSFFVTEGGRLLPHLGPSAGVVLSYAHRPMRLLTIAGPPAPASLVRYQLTADVLVGMGFFDRFEIGLALPLVLAQGSDGLAALGWTAARGIAGGLGDLRLTPKVKLWDRGPFVLALAATLAVPTGSDRDLLGGNGVTFTPRLIAALEWPRLGAALNVAYRMRNDASFAVAGGQRVIIDDQVRISAGVRVRLWRELELVGDLFSALSTHELDEEERPLELLFGVRYGFRHNIIATLGAGPGLSRGVGTPAFRLLAGFAIAPLAERPVKPPPPKPVVDLDPDRDGILGAADKCPYEPEDKDGFEDEDGCPDVDNDGDGIPDSRDKCPNEPEDVDGFEDEDGCPDPDNDHDGIPDVKDKCPNEPEDFDGFEDEDGCPDLDNDKDGIPDDQDKCPNEPEVFNGFEDEDGCPDVGPGPIQIEKGRIRVPTIYFATARDTVLKRSVRTLQQVAEALTKNPWLKRVRIEGHTDARGRPNVNLDLSQRRARRVMGHLSGFGIAAERLEAEGFGLTRPVASNKSPRGRAANRRVDFIIIDPQP